MMRVILIAACLNGKDVQKIFCFVLEEIFDISFFSCLWPVSDLLWSSGEETWRVSHSVLLCVWVLHEQLVRTSPPLLMEDWSVVAVHVNPRHRAGQSD